MKRDMPWIPRCLAMVHLGCGLLLLLGAAWYAALLFGAHPPVPRSGPWLIALASALVGSTILVIPQAALGLWMVVLARWLWHGHRGLRAALVLTHGFLVLLGLFLSVVGFHAVAAAERSTARGGGLLSPIAYIPLLFGVPMVVFAACVLAIALLGMLPRPPESR